MTISFDHEKLIIISPKSIHFDSQLEVNKSLKHEIKSIISRNKSLVEYKVKSNISQFLFK